MTSPPLSRTVVALESGPGFAVLLQAVRRGSGIRLTSLLEARGADATTRLTQVLHGEARRLARSETVVAAPVADLFGRWLPLPFPSLAKSRRVLPSLLEVELPFPLEDALVDVASPFPPEPSAPVWASALRCGQARQILRDVAAAGFDPVRLDHEGLALWTQAVSEAPGKGLRLIVHVRPDRVTVVAGRNTRPEAFAAIRRREGEDAATFASGALGARLRALRMPLAPPDEPVDVLWTGPSADEQAILETAFASWPACVHHIADTPSRFLARALAARALHPGPWRCEFRTGDLAHPRVEAARTRARWRPVRLAAAIAVAAGLSAWAHRARVEERQIDLETRLAGRAQAIAPGRRILPGREVQIAREAVEARRAALAPLLRITEGPSLTQDLAPLLAALHAQRVRVEELQLDDDRVVLVVAAEGDLGARLSAGVPGWTFSTRTDGPGRVRVEGRRAS